MPAYHNIAMLISLRGIAGAAMPKLLQDAGALIVRDCCDIFISRHLLSCWGSEDAAAAEQPNPARPSTLTCVDSDA
jgi:hypothetical protein